MLNKLTNYFNTFICIILCQLTKFIKISLMFGSKAIFFSASNIFFPLIGKFSNPITLLAIFAIQAILPLAMGTFKISTGIVPAIISLYHIPTLCAALYLTNMNRLFKIVLPLGAIATFITHPIGSQVYWYSFYWFIPAAIAILPKPNFFLQALGSTFTAHAVGSILWLHTYTLSASDWASLVSVVWAERLLMALGMTVVAHTFDAVTSLATDDRNLLVAQDEPIGSGCCENSIMLINSARADK